VLRTLLSALLVLEGLVAGTWVAGHLSLLAVYPAVTLALMAVRGFVGALEFAAGWLVIRRQPAALRFAEVALVSSAVLLTLEIGADLAPNSFLPGYRWPAVVVYWVYAAGWVALIRTRLASSRGRP
jgi:hypothetical protein